jgi:hypothetical protein
MLGLLRRHASFSNVVALICLFVVLGGTSFASDTARSVRAFASKLITGKQVKDSSLTGKDIKDKSLTAADFKGSVAGPQGPVGPKGDKGEPGPAGSIQSAPAGGDLTGSYPNPSIGSGKVTSDNVFDGTLKAADLDASLLNGPPGSPGLRSLGTGANEAAAGNDPRLSNARPPTGGAGGSLTGSYPNPSLAGGSVGSDQIVDGSVGAAEIGGGAVGMDELDENSLAQGSSNAVGVAITPNTTQYILGTAFTPPSDGVCVVGVTVVVTTTGNDTGADSPYVGIARSTDGTNEGAGGGYAAYFPGAANSGVKQTVSRTGLAAVSGGKSTRFGATITGAGATFADDETAYVSESHICF